MKDKKVVREVKDVIIIHTDANGQQVLCDRCAIGYTEFCNENYGEPPKFCTCEECMEFVNEHDGCEMECAFCGGKIICRSMTKLL